jgi:hypothetical protein
MRRNQKPPAGALLIRPRQRLLELIFARAPDAFHNIINAAPHGDHFSHSVGPSPRQEAKSKNAQYNELLGAPIAMLNGFLCAA